MLFALLILTQWLSVPSAPVATESDRAAQRAADGTSWFAATVTNEAEVSSAKWTVAGLGVFEAYVNGKRVGEDFLKPGFSSADKTKYSFSYDVMALMKTGKGEANALVASVSSGWWRDQIVGYAGRKSAFRGELELTFADGTHRAYGTDADSWKCGIAGCVTHAGIFDGEEYDARRSEPLFGEGLTETPEVNVEFKGEVLPSAGAEICLREDLKICRGPFIVRRGESLVVDFGQNCAAVPRFRFKAKRGTVLTVLPGEMQNDADKGVRGCDGPKGSVYRANLRMPDTGMRVIYTFAGEGVEEYMPRFTFFGYRYLSLTATDDVEIGCVESVPVTSIAKSMELGKLETGDAALNRFISNVYWGQLSNYLSVPTDCPQRNERLGWTADAQVFAEAGSFNADAAAFFRKWMRDMCDSVNANGAFSGIAPIGQYGARYMRFGWSDAGVIVPYTVWRQFGDRRIVRENWTAMCRYVDHVAATRYAHKAIWDEVSGRQYADWLSFEDYESCSGRNVWETGPDGKRRQTAAAECYWDFLGGSYWLSDARQMAAMAKGIGDAAAAEKYGKMADEALTYLRGRFVDPKDGRLLQMFRPLQTPAVFALKFGLLTDDRAVEATKRALRENIAAHDGCLTTGFLGTSFLMDALTENGMADVAYGLLLNHKFPSWLYSVDQGATTVWERWNSYTKEKGFGPVEMNSFNHYAYGAVLAWMYRTMAGIAADPEHPGFENILMSPVPDRRVGSVFAEYRTPRGLVRSAWRYEGGEWVWEFAIPDGATATVIVPGERKGRHYGPGRYSVRAAL